MKRLFAGLVLATFSLTIHPSEAKDKKPIAPRAQDRSMSAYPYESPYETPTFRWSGQSSWGRPGVSDAFPTESANGS
jgi:hypothetical protein